MITERGGVEIMRGARFCHEVKPADLGHLQLRFRGMPLEMVLGVALTGQIGDSGAGK